MKSRIAGVINRSRARSTPDPEPVCVTTAIECPIGNNRSMYPSSTLNGTPHIGIGFGAFLSREVRVRLRVLATTTASSKKSS